jgi:hypothetical protein
MQEALDDPFGPLSKNNTLSPQEFAQMQRADQARAAAGYTVDPSGLASRVGELRADRRHAVAQDLAAEHVGVEVTRPKPRPMTC